MTRLTLETLQTVYKLPHPIAQAKVLDCLDKHARRFLELSPFCILATVGANGAVDASPRGGDPGFVKAESDRSLLLPDRAGNNRIDSIRNILEGSHQGGMLFMIPGVYETLRINGLAEVIVDAEIFKSFIDRGKPPKALIRITLQEMFLHCAKSLMRSELWSATAQVDRSVLPTIAEMTRDQIADDIPAWGPPETQAEMTSRWRRDL